MTRVHCSLFCFITLLTLTITSRAATIDAANAAAEYARLQKWQFSQPITLPAGGVTFTRDTAKWTLKSGTVRLMQPTASGAVTGVVFEGAGTFHMTIPDRYELAQLRRFAEDRDLDAIDVSVTQMVLRTSDSSLIDLFPRAPENAVYAPLSLAEKRHEDWLVKELHDADARIVATMLSPGTVKIVADMKTDAYDWLTWGYDSSNVEEITLTNRHPVGPESWVSLDRAEDRQADGRPGSRSSAAASLEHIDVKADLTKAGRIGEVGRHNQRTMNGQYVVEATYRGVAEELSALQLELWVVAQEVRAFDESGQPLTLLRDHIGKRSRMLDKRVYDNDLVVVLPAPLRRGETRRIRFEYEIETANFVPGNAWYPTIPDAIEQKHTARLELTVRKRNEVRAMGRLDSRRDDPKTETTVWVVDRPAKMITFSTATRFEEVKLAPQGIPRVVAFGPDYQFDNRDKVHNVGADVANSIAFFQKMLDDKLPVEEVYVTSIASGHGQAFDGFLHMGEFTFASEHPGASELFRAHEVAHAWWGHKVGWKSYRDQWLSETFAEYSAMLFVREMVKGGGKYFDEILRSYDGIVKGNFAGGFSKFNRPWLIEFNSASRRRTGPIGHGYRGATGEVPTAYIVAAYHKGPLVLHMLRSLLLFRTHNDEVFRSVLRDFQREYSGKAASTEDFRHVLERHAGGDWGWFFDAWIYRAEIPSYTWRYSVAPADDGFALTVTLKRRDAGEGFSTIIPLRVDMDNGKSGFLFIVNDKDEQTFTRKVSARPKNVVFAPDFSLLAHIKRD